MPQFLVDELTAELDCLRKVARRFLAPGAEQRIQAACSTLKARTRSASQQVFAWEVSMNAPIETKQSEGGHQRGKQGAQSISAAVGWKWELKIPKAHVVEISGVASVLLVFRIHDDEVSQNTVEMCFDVAAGQNIPGPTFHSQIKRVGQTTMRFEGSDLDVPRVASVVLTPAECVELALSELFQDEWPKEVLKEQSTYVSVWSNQRARLKKFLNAAVNRLSSTGGPAVSALKTWRPRGEDFAHESNEKPQAGKGR
jgi:hypothetical protein